MGMAVCRWPDALPTSVPPFQRSSESVPTGQIQEQNERLRSSETDDVQEDHQGRRVDPVDETGHDPPLRLNRAEMG